MFESILAILASFLIATLSGLGVGSAGLLVVWLTAVEKLPQLESQGINLYFFLFSSSASLLVHLRRRKIMWGAVLLMTSFGVAGALIGTRLAARADPSLLRRLFGLMLLASGGMSLIRAVGAFKKRGAGEKP